MQKLYKTWQNPFGWDARVAVHSSPPGTDPALLNGEALETAGRTTAISFWALQRDKQIHLVADLSKEAQIVAMIRHKDWAFDSRTAAAGIRMLFAIGTALSNLLQAHGLLENMPHAEGSSIFSLCTRMRQVRLFFPDT